MITRANEERDAEISKKLADVNRRSEQGRGGGQS